MNLSFVVRIPFRSVALFGLIVMAQNFARAGDPAELNSIDVLKRSGWREIARCDDGHQWSYILEKSGENKICKGINARSGPSEDACVEFTGSLEKFKSVAVKIKQKKPRLNCWSGFGQDL